MARSLIARNVIIRIEAPDGVHLKNHRQPRSSARSLGGNQKRAVRAEKRSFSSLSGSEKRAAALNTAELNYATVSGLGAGNAGGKIAFTRQTKAEASVRPEVRVRQRRPKPARERTRVKLADEGKTKDAIALLRDQAAKNAAGAAVQVPGVPRKIAAEDRERDGFAGQLRSGGSRCSSRITRQVPEESLIASRSGYGGAGAGDRGAGEKSVFLGDSREPRALGRDARCGVRRDFTSGRRIWDGRAAHPYSANENLIRSPSVKRDLDFLSRDFLRACWAARVAGGTAAIILERRT